MGAGMTAPGERRHESGFSLIETMIAMSVLTVGAVGMAAAFLHGMNSATSSPGELIATQKAAEALESVFSARDSRKITWAELENVEDDGVFMDDATPMRLAGDDGIFNTEDDGDVESIEYPGADGDLETPLDNVTQTLDGYTRKIRIETISAVLRSVTVTVTYKSGSATRSFELTTYISQFS
jgi:prepilin-type N-terminal cleavage/methylation domain-containing protein